MVVPIQCKDDKLFILDQTLLPEKEVYLEISTKEQLWEAIKKLRVRGAPAIGIAAAFGIYVSVKNSTAPSFDEFLLELRKAKDYLASARPTAVNLFWALDRMERKLWEQGQSQNCDSLVCCKDCIDWPARLRQIKSVLLAEAEKIRAEDEAACQSMGEYGLSLLKKNMGILTHCNAGSLATARYGTCLAPIYLGQEKDYHFRVFADETRPLLQGARLTVWELMKEGVDVTLICDNMAAAVMRKGWIDAVVVGCDRMARNGDGANKIGTSGLAVLAKEYKIPFYMFVPTSTIDLQMASGEAMIIEERSAEEIYAMWYEKPMAPDGVKTFNPSFDVTDHRHITAVITERGIVYPPYDVNLRALFEREEETL
jgi:methylthioribose-1-phosphate isomerase